MADESKMEAASSDIAGVLKFFLCLFNPLILLAMMNVSWSLSTILQLIAAFICPFVGIRLLIKGQRKKGRKRK